MKISPVSFGKIYRVQAPYQIAEQLAATANSKSETTIAEKLKTIFGKEYVGLYYNSFGNYHLSGKDRDFYQGKYDKYTAWGCGNEEWKTYNRIMQKYISENIYGTITVAHNGIKPSAIDVISSR